MSVSEISRPTVEAPEAPAEAAAYARCGECGAPVDDVQRYCVICGSHRRHVPDPAARYLSEASARARAHARAAAARSARGRRRSLGARGTAILVALVPLAGVAGVAIGSSTSGSPAPAHHGAAAHHGTSAASKTLGTSSSSTGSSYVQSQNNLPNSVSP